MRYANLRNVDLNLLLGFNALMEERSITGAARRMFLSQPAMSRVVDRLQVMFKDELLVRTSSGYEPTHRAMAIYAELQEILPRVAGLFSESEFDPASESELFRIESTDLGATVIVPSLIKVLNQRAPGVRIDVIPRAGGFERLQTNEVDLVLTRSTELLPDGEPQRQQLRSEPLFAEKLVCLIRKDHPLARGRLRLRDYLQAQHVLLTPMQGPKRASEAMPARQPTLVKAFERLGRKPNIRLRIPYFVPLGPIVESSDLVATVPLQIARRLETPRLRIVALPVEVEGFTYNQVWHSRNDATPVHRWLRGLIRTIAEGLDREETDK